MHGSSSKHGIWNERQKHVNENRSEYKPRDRPHEAKEQTFGEELLSQAHNRSPESKPDCHLLPATGASRDQKAGDVCACDEQDRDDCTEEDEPDLLGLTGEPRAEGQDDDA